jgi:hypothetical protein
VIIIFPKIKEYLDELVDTYTIKLLKLTGIQLKDNYSHYELLCPNNTILKDTGYIIIRYTSIVTNEESIGLYYNGETVIEYEFKVEFENNTIKIIPKEIK